MVYTRSIGKFIKELTASLLWLAAVSGATWLLSKVFDLKLFTAPVPSWTLALAVSMFMILLVYSFINFSNRRRCIFVMIPAFSHKHWFAKLLQNLIREFETKGYDVVVKIPSSDFSPQGQTSQFRSIRENRSRFVGGLIVAVESSDLHQNASKFCGDLSLPIVFMDVRPFSRPGDYPPNSAFVGYDAGEIGERAARCVATSIIERAIVNPQVLVIGSDSQAGRQQMFEKVLKEKIPTAEITVTNKGAFRRDRARAIADSMLREAMKGNQTVDIIFCTNDEMALGAVDAVHAINNKFVQKTYIIGVDGTEEAIALIESRGTPLRATVVQDPSRVAEVASGLLQNMLASETIERETLLTPEIYPIDRSDT